MLRLLKEAKAPIVTYRGIGREVGYPYRQWKRFAICVTGLGLGRVRWNGPSPMYIELDEDLLRIAKELGFDLSCLGRRACHVAMLLMVAAVEGMYSFDAEDVKKRYGLPSIGLKGLECLIEQGAMVLEDGAYVLSPKLRELAARREMAKLMALIACATGRIDYSAESLEAYMLAVEYAAATRLNQLAGQG